MFLSRRVFLVSSAGGHLTQLLRLAKGLTDYEIHLVTEATPVALRSNYGEFSCSHFLIHGGREKKMLYPLKLLINSSKSLWLFIKYRPRVIISTGAHTAVPICLIGKLSSSKIIFIESFARVSTPSMSGRILYRVADRFYIQWPALKKYYPQAIYRGGLY